MNTLDLTVIKYRDYALSAQVFEQRYLKELHLTGCEISASLILCSGLVSLSLCHGSIGDDLLHYILLTCPLIQNLKLQNLKGLRIVDLSIMHSIKSLFVDFCVIQDSL